MHQLLQLAAQMKPLFTGLTLCFLMTAAEPTRTLKLDVADGGSVVTQLSATIAVNKGSSLSAMGHYQ
jgi:hypothetical protein